MSRQNEIYALHLDGKLQPAHYWQEEIDKLYQNKYRRSPHTRTKQKLYLTEAQAKAAIKQIDKAIIHRIEIVRYIPAPIPTPCYPPSGRRLTPWSN